MGRDGTGRLRADSFGNSGDRLECAFAQRLLHPSNSRPCTDRSNSTDSRSDSRSSSSRACLTTRRSLRPVTRNLLQLYQWGKSGLTAAQRSATVSRLAPPSDEVAGWNYWDVVSNFDRMRKVQLPADTCGAVVVAWLKAQQELDGVSLSDPDRLGYLSWMLNSLGTRATDFSVFWTGSVKAPYDGAYTFSICPIDVRRDGTTDVWVKEKMAVSVGGQQVLNAGTGDWMPDGTPVRLKAGQSTALQVNFSYSTNYARHPAIVSGDCPALVAGAGGEQAVGSGRRLVVGRRDAAGAGGTILMGSIQRRSRGHGSADFDDYGAGDRPRVDGEHSFSGWIRGAACVVGIAGGRVGHGAGLLGPIGGESRSAALFATGDDSSDSSKNVLERSLLAMLNSSQQTAFAEALLARPALLGSVSLAAICQLYQICWVTAPDTALQLFGKSAQCIRRRSHSLGGTCTERIGGIITCWVTR